MSFSTLISTADLAAQLGDPHWAVVDCRFALTGINKGRRDHLAAHVPGALYAHLDDDLSGPIVQGKTGRHPLPALESLVRTLSSWGIDDKVQVVVYDDAGGAYAGRLWWMLRWLGHDAVAVLDGDWRRWQQEGRPTVAGAESRPLRRFTACPHPELIATAEEVAAHLRAPAPHLFDARAAERYRGENETIDPRGGHIPGALSAPYAGNLTAGGSFLSAGELRARWTALLNDTPVSQAIMYCGSGVTAAHNILALEQAGLGLARLYVGSWSDWITDPERPIATGATP